MSKKNLVPRRNRKIDAEEEAQKVEASQKETIKVKKTKRMRIGLLIPPQLKANLYEEANETGRSVTDIVVEQLNKRYL